MTDQTVTNDRGLTLLGRLIDSLHQRRLGFFMAELLLVIAGVLIALAVDGWISDLHDRQTEVIYLDLLASDVEKIRNEINLQIEFEKEKVEAAGRAYTALTDSNPSSEREEIELSLALLVSRRTLSLKSATYDQMVSSGHLQLIENFELRDGIVRYFAEMERNQRIAENNNREIVDDIFLPFLLQIGVTPMLRPETLQVTSSLNRATAIMYEQLGADYAHPEDRVLSAPAETDSWNDLRRNVLLRMRIAATGQALAEGAIDQTTNIATALAAELMSH